MCCAKCRKCECVSVLAVDDDCGGTESKASAWHRRLCTWFAMPCVVGHVVPNKCIECVPLFANVRCGGVECMCGGEESECTCTVADASVVCFLSLPIALARSLLRSLRVLVRPFPMCAIWCVRGLKNVRRAFYGRAF